MNGIKTATKGVLETGDIAKSWNEENYDVITITHPEELTPEVLAEQLPEIVGMAEAFGLENINLVGHSFGGFATPEAMATINQNQLNRFLAKISRLRFPSTPTCARDSGARLVCLEKSQKVKGTKVWAQRLRHAMFTLSELRQGRKGVRELLIRGPARNQ